jgi:hypothetical protein
LWVIYEGKPLVVVSKILHTKNRERQGGRRRQKRVEEGRRGELDCLDKRDTGFSELACQHDPPIQRNKIHCSFHVHPEPVLSLQPVLSPP